MSTAPSRLGMLRLAEYKGRHVFSKKLTAQRPRSSPPQLIRLTLQQDRWQVQPDRTNRRATSG